jgi:hypothetical protein
LEHCFGENYMVATFTPTIGFLGSNLITLLDLKTPLLLSKDSNYRSTSLRGLPSLPMTIRSRWTKLRSRTRIMLLNKNVSKASKVSVQFSGWTQARPLAPIIGSAGLIWNVGGPPRVAFQLVVADDRVVEIDLVADHEQLDQLNWVLLDG